MLTHTLQQLAQVLDVGIEKLLPPPEDSAPTAGSARARVEAELARKLKLPPQKIAALARKLGHTEDV